MSPENSSGVTRTGAWLAGGHAPADPVAEASTRRSRKPPNRRATIRRYVYIYAWLMVPLTLLMVFWLYPLFDMVRLSLTNLNALNFNFPQWVGFANFEHALKSPVFWQAVRNTGEYMAIKLPVEVPLALLVAALSARIRRARSAFLAAYFLPVVVSLTAISLLFLYLYSPTNGPLNGILQALGLGPLAYLNSTSQALPSIEAIDIWHSLGYAMVLLLAALQSVPSELVEAAQVDGAGRWNMFARITLPLILPILGVVIINDVTSEMQLFAPIFVMTGATQSPGGPLHSTLNLITYTYNVSFREYALGYGSALSLIIFVVNLLLTLLVLKVSRTNRLWQ